LTAAKTADEAKNMIESEPERVCTTPEEIMILQEVAIVLLTQNGGLLIQKGYIPLLLL
jgi:hypothetical protein